MKKQFTVLLLLCFITTGCTGSFNLTRKVYNFHRSQDDKWADEFMFLGCVLLPIYGFSTFADAIVFNSIEFWTGENPVEMSQAEANSKFVKQDGNEAEIRYNPKTDRITVQSRTIDGQTNTVVLEKNDHMVKATDEDGNLIYLSSRTPTGDIGVYNADLELVKNYSPAELQELKQKSQP